MQDVLTGFAGIAEYGATIVCLAGLFALVWYLLKFTNETTQEALKENREQTSKFIETTERFCEIVKEQNMKIDNKLDRISDKLDDIQNHHYNNNNH